MAEELINEIFDIPALKKQQDEFLKIIKESADAVAGFANESAKQKGDAGTAKTLNETKKAAEAAAITYDNLKKKTSELSAEEQALQRTRKQLIRAQAQQTETGQALMSNIAKERAALKELATDQNLAARSARSQTDYTKAFSKELDLATMNVSEMQAELSRLNRMSFSGLSPEQIAKVKAQMGLLKEEIGDFNKRIAASGDKTNVMIGALRGLTSIAQVGTGIMSAFGIENERLEKTMVQLIGVSQALTTIHELREKGTMRDTAAIIKNTAAKYFNLTATKAEAIAQKSATASTKAGAVGFKVLGAAMKSLPIMWLVVGLAAIGTGIAYLSGAFNKETDAVRRNRIAMESVGDAQRAGIASTMETQIKVRALVGVIDDHTKSEKERQTALDGVNEIMGTTLTLTDDITTATENYIAALISQAQADAIVTRMAEINNQLADQKKLAEDAGVSWLGGVARGVNDLLGLRAYGTTAEKVEAARLAEAIGDLTAEYDALNGQLTGITNTNVKQQQSAAAAKTAAQQQADALKVQQQNAQKAADAWAELVKKSKEFYDELYKASLNDKDRLKLEYDEKFKQLDDYHAKGLISEAEFKTANLQLLKEFQDKSDAIIIAASNKEVAEYEKTYEYKKSIAQLNLNEMIKYIDSQIAAEGVSQEETIKLLDKKKQAFYEYYDVLLKAAEEAANEDGEVTMAELEGLDTLTKKRDEYTETVINSDEKTTESARKTASERNQLLSDYADRAMSLYGAINAYQSQLSDNEQAELQARLDAGLISQEQYDAQVAQIQAEAAERNKAFAAAQVVIDTAKSIMSIWGDPSLPVVAKIIFSALAGVTGGVQLATINAQTIPGYYTGRDGGDAELAYVGERGSEAVINDGSVWFTPPTKTLTYLPENSSVLTASETVRAMQAGMFTNSTIESGPDKLDELIRVVKNKKETSLNITEKGLGMTAKKAANYMYYINRNCRS